MRIPLVRRRNENDQFVFLVSNMSGVGCTYKVSGRCRLKNMIGKMIIGTGMRSGRERKTWHSTQNKEVVRSNRLSVTIIVKSKEQG